MQLPKRAMAAALIFAAIAWVGIACDRVSMPTEPQLIGAQTSAAVISSASADLLVDDDKVQCPTATFTTIQDAINAASGAQVIFVCAGLYPELAPGPLTVNKSVTLVGAQNGIDARDRVGAESIIADINGTLIAASNVIIDGFTVQNSAVPEATGYGILMRGGIGGTRILNNIIQHNIVGIGLANDGPRAIIRRNWIRANNLVGPQNGSGIYTDQFAIGRQIVRDVLIEENRFSDHAEGGASIWINNTDFVTGGVFGLEVRSNSFSRNSRAMFLFNTHDSRFHDNTITGSTLTGSADFRLGDKNTDLSFTSNDLSDGASHAIWMAPRFGIPNERVEFHQNNIERYALTGITVEPGGHVGTVNAECNWWNSPGGPAAADNPGGTGEEVVGDVDYRPWLVARAPGGACRGGVPEGKVSGGGQINVAGGKGTFGFNARQSQEGTSGHLNYLNHATRAHLDCTVTIVTVLTPTRAEFEGTCNEKSSARSFRAVVRDNGKSGKTDEFRITYGAVTEGGVLRSGNIQIHD